MPSNLKQYLPVLGVVIAAVLGYLASALTDNRITLEELANLGLAFLGALTTYVVPRLENVTWLKPAVAFLFAALQALVSFLTDGITPAEWVLIALAGLGAIGVAATNTQVPVTRPEPLTAELNPPAA